MTKMSMVWVAVATLTHPRTDVTVTKKDIDRQVWKLFRTEISPTMINSHLVSSVDRQADKNKPQQGGSRNRSLFKESDGTYRLYKETDKNQDGWEKHKLSCPCIDAIADEYQHLITWYKTVYFDS